MWAFLVNPPKGGKKVAKKAKSKPKTAEGRKYRSLVKRLGVKQAAKEYRKWKREHKKGSSRKASKPKGGTSMAKKKTARGGYRALVKKHGVKKAAKMWRASGKKSGKKSYSRNPKGRSTTTKAKAYRSLVKKHGVQKAAKMWRASGKAKGKKYAANAWTGGRKTDRRIASAAGWARRKGVPAPLYLRQKGFSQAQIDRYIGKHGAVGSHKRSYTRSHPVSAGRRYAMNPLSTAVETVKGVATMDTVKTIGSVTLGFMGVAIGHAVVKKLRPMANTPAIMSGEIGGSLVAGAAYAVVTKDVGRGLLTASSGIALSLFKFAYDQWFPKKLLGVDMPILSMGNAGDYVELPYGMSDYVELPYGRAYGGGMGQSLQTGMGQFLPPEAAQVGQFIPEQFGEYTVGIGEEAEIEY